MSIKVCYGTICKLKNQLSSRFRKFCLICVQYTIKCCNKWFLTFFKSLVPYETYVDIYFGIKIDFSRKYSQMCHFGASVSKLKGFRGGFQKIGMYPHWWYNSGEKKLNFRVGFFKIFQTYLFFSKFLPIFCHFTGQKCQYLGYNRLDIKEPSIIWHT